MTNLRDSFLEEAAGTIAKCHAILVQLRSSPGDRAHLHALTLLVDNLCEPAQMAGVEPVYDVAVALRQALRIIIDKGVVPTAKIRTQLEQGCAYLHGLISGIRGAVAGTVDHAFAVTLFAAAPTASFDLTDLGPAGHLVHDLKSPYGIIKATAELLAEGDTKVGPGLERIVRQADKGLSLVASLLAGSGVGPSSQSSVRLNLAEAVNQCFDGLGVLAMQTGVELCHAIDSAWELEANPLHLAQILDNLVGNALKYTPPGGKVSVAGERLELVVAGKKRPSILVHVSDRGRGIAAEALPFVFMSHVQALESDWAKGSGLGLAIAKKLCELNGGTIWVRSEPHVETIFSFALPASR